MSTLHTIIIEFTDDPDMIDNHGLGTYKTLPNGNKIVKAYMKNESSYNEAFLICLHELVEQRLTEMRGIKEEDIDSFDKKIDQEGGQSDEAGNEPNSPYLREHRFAENIERLMAYEMGINWQEYYNNYQV